MTAASIDPDRPELPEVAHLRQALRRTRMCHEVEIAALHDAIARLAGVIPT